MQEGEDDEVLHVKGLRLYFRDPHFPFQKRLSRPVAQGADQIGPNHLDLLHEERFTSIHFIRLRIAVVGRPALDDVGDVNLIA